MSSNTAITCQVAVTLPPWVPQFAATIQPCPTDSERMRVAIELSRRNVDEGTGGPFGAAVFDRASGRLAAVGVNRVLPLANSVLHAEVVALMLAEARIGSYTLDDPGVPGHELFTSCDPCAMCLGAIWWSGVQRVVCAATRDDVTALGFDEGPVFDASYEYLRDRGVEVGHGVLRSEARAVLENYIRSAGKLYNG